MEFKEVLKKVKLFNKKGFDPHTSLIKLSIKDKQCIIEKIDEMKCYKATIPSPFDDMDVVVDFDALFSIIKNLDTFNLSKDKNNLKISSNGKEFVIPVYPNDDFPQLPNDSFEEICKTDYFIFNYYVPLYSSFCYNNSLRPAIQSVLIEQKGKVLSVVATDAHRLILKNINAVQSNNFHLLIQKDVAKVFSAFEYDSVTIYQNDSFYLFDFEFEQVFVRRIEANYPNYLAVIPNESLSELHIVKEDLLNIMKTIPNSVEKLMFNLSESKSVVTNVKDDASVVTFNLELPAQYKGNGLNISVNRNLLQKFLNVFNGMLKFEFTYYDKAIVITDTDVDKKGLLTPLLS